jgi:ABC-type transporter Mla subunit MlaD
MQTLAERLYETTTNLKKLPLNDPQLREFREQAIAVSQGFSEIFHETGKALELANQVRPTREGLKTLNDTQTRLKGAIDSLENNTKTANRLVAEVNRYCGANLP